MKIMHDNAAMMALGDLNKNNNNLNRTLKKVSKGEKLDLASSSAGYGISERMRAMVRSLEQDIKNAQSGQNMLKVAEGAVNSTIDILKTLKEKAIDSASDHNTDHDRAIIQRQVRELVDQVDTNTLTTYNGKRLLDGSTISGEPTVEQHIIKALQTEWVENTLDLIKDAYGVSFSDYLYEKKDISVQFKRNGEMDASTLAAVASWAVPGEKAERQELWINMDQFASLDVKDKANVNGTNAAGTGTLDRTIAHEFTHAIMAAGIAGFSSLPSSIKEGMAELVHGIDDQRRSGLTKGTITATDFSFVDDGSGVTPINMYTGGYMALRYMAAQSDGRDAMERFMKTLVEAGGDTAGLNKAVNVATQGKFASWTDLTDDLKAKAAASTLSDADFLKQTCGIDLNNKDTGSIVGSDGGPTSTPRTGDNIVPEAGSTKFWYSPAGGVSVINGLNIYWGDNWKSNNGDMVLHIGPKAGQAIRFGILDMSAEAMGLKNANGDLISLVTKEDANMAMRVLDQALQRATNVQTTIGALRSRLDMTVSNLTQASEHTQFSESTIRDADMAREMTDLAKNNVLSQAAQSMLAQANQNKGQVISLLQ